MTELKQKISWTTSASKRSSVDVKFTTGTLDMTLISRWIYQLSNINGSLKYFLRTNTKFLLNFNDHIWN